VITHYFSHAQYDKLLRSWLRLERYHPISAPFLYRIYQDDQPMQILCGTSPMLHPIVMQALRQRKVVELLLERDKIHSLLASYSDHVWKPFRWIGVTAIALCITHCLLPLGSLLWCMIIVQWLYLWLGMAACLVYLRLPASVEEHVRLFKSQHFHTTHRHFSLPNKVRQTNSRLLLMANTRTTVSFDGGCRFGRNGPKRGSYWNWNIDFERRALSRCATLMSG
jgi:hypothetical protein